MPVPFDLRHIDELIAARKALVNQPHGRPPIENGETLGLAVQRASIVMMSAVIQSFVEDVFLEASRQVLTPLGRIGDISKYQKSYSRNGNPNPNNITRLFLRLGIEDVLSGLRWQKCNNETVCRKLNHLNQLRNDIAHGKTELRVDGRVVQLRQTMVTDYRNFAEQFGNRFEAHVMGKL